MKFKGDIYRICGKERWVDTMRPQRIRISHDEILEALREAGKEETTDNALMMAYKLGFRDCREKAVELIKEIRSES